MQAFCQWILVAILAFTFFSMTKKDFERERDGFFSFLIGTALFALIVLIYLGAGAFSVLFG